MDTYLAFEEKSNCSLLIGVGIESSKLECWVSDVGRISCDDESFTSLELIAREIDTCSQLYI